MKSFTKRSKIVIKGVLLSVLIIFLTNSVLAQSAFNRNDSYDFRGKHHLTAGGSNPDNFNIFIESDSDFRFFKLQIKKSRLHLNIAWFAINYRVDMNNDGSWELGWSSYDETTVNYLYPNPPDGTSANHTVKVEIEFFNYGSGSVFRTKTKQINVFSTPRVFVDSDDNSFIQLRNEDATNKIPVLLVEGFDPLNEKYPDTYYELTWELINTDLYPNNYEVFILNFYNGGRDLRLNADVLMKAIEKIHEVCPNYKIAIAGLSMGGPIGRYGLAKKESQGETHHVGLFLSYDSPQWYAHVSPDLQDWIKIQNPNEGAIGELQANLQSVGAKQMLRYNTYDQSSSFHDEFYNELNTLNGDGYPHQCYNVAVSNGNLEATYGWELQGMYLMTLRINDNLIKDVPAVPLDLGTGSMITDITTKRYGDIFSNPLIHIYYELEILFNPSYTPTFSSLDLINPQFNQLSGDIESFEGSKFDDFEMQETPLQHHELSPTTQNKIMVWLNKDLNITVNYSLPEGGFVNPENYQVNILHGLPITIQPKTVTVSGKIVTYTFVKWEDGSTENPRTFYTSHDVAHTAIMKGTQLSDNQNTYSNNSQRKIVKAPDGNMYNTYESMGYVWLERSADQGLNWELINNGKPLGNTYGISPCIDYHPDNNLIVVSWQKNIGGSTYKLCYLVAKPSINFYREGDIEWVGSPPPESPLYSSDAQMVVSWNPHNYALFVWKENQDLLASICLLEQNSTIWKKSRIIHNDGADYSSPTLYCNKLILTTNNEEYFHLAYQNYTREIQYRLLTFNTVTNNLSFISPTVISSGSGYGTNYSPVITGTDWIIPGITWQEFIRFAWIGYRESAPDEIPPEGAGSTPYGESRVINKFKAPTYWSKISVWGNNVGSISMNKGITAIDHYQPMGMAWSEWNGSNIQNKYIRTHDIYPTPIRTLSTTGQEIQVNNSNDFFDMYVNSYHHSTQPYFFNLSENLSGGLNKIESLPIFKGREGVVSKDSTDFYYAIGDITLNGENVDFILMPDSLIISDEQVMNEYLSSEPFNVNNVTILTYGVQYGIIDSLEAINALSDGSEINFKVELLDNQTGEILGVFDEVSYTSENVFQYNNIGYQVDLNGIGNRTVRLKLFVSSSASCNYAISERFSDTGALNKGGFKCITYEENTIVKKYSLEQNYPNPFNPTTSIKYQIPSSGNVSIKVYDILGNEVVTLVDEQKESGRYEVNFDASKFASGVYIYRLNVNDYTSVKKMVLVK